MRLLNELSVFPNGGIDLKRRIHSYLTAIR